jgi:hypothetical protein
VTPTHAQAVFDYLQLQMSRADQLNKTASSLFVFNSCHSFSDFLPCASKPQANLLLTKKKDRYLSRCKSHKTPLLFHELQREIRFQTQIVIEYDFIFFLTLFYKYLFQLNLMSTEVSECDYERTRIKC